MKSYKKLNRSIFIFFVLWFGGALITGHFFAHRQNLFYPFYSWRLFENVYDRMYDYGVEIVSLEDETFEPPIDFIDEIVPKSLSLVKLFSQPDKVVQSMGRAVDHGNEIVLSNLHVYFERKYLHQYKSGIYRVVKRVWDPVAAWNMRKKGNWLIKKEVLLTREFKKASANPYDKN